MPEYEFREVRAWECTYCKQILQVMDEAESCGAAKCPYRNLVPWSEEVKDYADGQ